MDLYFQLMAVGILLGITALQWVLHRSLGKVALLTLAALIAGGALYLAYVEIPNSIETSIKKNACFNCQMAVIASSVLLYFAIYVGISALAIAALCRRKLGLDPSHSYT